MEISSVGRRSEINVTPLIDVLLVLLIIFMVIVPVTPRGLTSAVPRSTSSATTSQPPVSVRMMASADGSAMRCSVEGQGIGCGELQAAVTAALGTRSDRGVWIAASPALSYEAVAGAVGAARAAGATAVGLGRVEPRAAWQSDEAKPM